MQPIFSVIIPTYNGSRFIEQTIRSVLNQTFSNLELIVVDDGSTDNTASIIEKLASEDKRIILKKIPNSGGPTIPSNLGISLAQGKYIAFLDHDDEWKQDKLEKVLKVFEENKKIDIVCSAVEILQNETGKKQLSSLKRRINTKTDMLSGAYFNTFSMIVVKKEVFQSVGVLDTKLLVFGDYEFMARSIAADKEVFFIDEPLVVYRVHENNTSSLQKNIDRRVRDLMYILSSHADIYNTHARAKAVVLQAIGRLNLEMGKKSEAIRYFCKSVLAWPFTIRGYIRIIVVLAGGRVYKNIEQLGKVFILLG